MAGGDRQPSHTVGVEGARPYGIGGVVPADAVVTGHRMVGRGIPYVSDTEWTPAYADREQCTSLRTDGQSCRAKAIPGTILCDAHGVKE